MMRSAEIEAHRFFERQATDRQVNREQLLEQCAQHLADSFCLTTTSALQLAMSALSEIESAGAEGFIDIERSTPQMVLMRDSARRTFHMVSAGELLQLVRKRFTHRDPPPSTG